MIIYQDSNRHYNNSVAAQSTHSKKKRVKASTSKRSLKRGNINFLKKLGLKIKIKNKKSKK